MAFTVNDFQDLLALLRQNPEWLAELRQLIIADDFERIEAALDRMREELHETRREFDERMRALDAKIGNLVDAQSRTELHLDRLNVEAGRSRGHRVAYHFRENIAGYLGAYYDRGKRILVSDLAAAIGALRKGEIDKHQWDQLVALDVLYRGFEPNGNGTRHEVIVPMEVSAVIDRHDVTRAQTRAQLLHKLGYDARPYVAGESIVPDARELAVTLGVEVLLAPQVDQIA